MPLPIRLDSEVEAKAFGSFLGAVVIGGAKWLWEKAKDRGRNGAKVPAYLRVEQLEADLAREKARADYATAEAFDIRNRWGERVNAHAEKQRRMYERMKSAEASARAKGAEIADLDDALAKARAEIDDLKGETTLLAYEPSRPVPTEVPHPTAEG